MTLLLELVSRVCDDVLNRHALPVHLTEEDKGNSNGLTPRNLYDDSCEFQDKRKSKTSIIPERKIPEEVEFIWSVHKMNDSESRARSHFILRPAQKRRAKQRWMTCDHAGRGLPASLEMVNSSIRNSVFRNVFGTTVLV